VVVVAGAAGASAGADSLAFLEAAVSFLGAIVEGGFLVVEKRRCGLKNAVKTKSKKRRRKKGFRRGGEGKKRKEERN